MGEILLCLALLNFAILDHLIHWDDPIICIHLDDDYDCYGINESITIGLVNTNDNSEYWFAFGVSLIEDSDNILLLWLLRDNLCRGYTCK